MTEEKFRATPIYVVPIFASLVVGILCTFLISQSGTELTGLMNLPETGLGSLYVAIAFVFASGFGATLIYFLLKRGIYRFIRFLMGVAFSVLTFCIVILYSDLAFLTVNVEVPILVILSLASLATVFVVLEISLRKGRFYEVIILVLGGTTGTLLGASIPAFSVVLILLLLAVYDVIAVFHGPIGKIASKGLEYLPGASFSFRDIHVGLGDLTFYSMLVSTVFLNFGWETCVAATFGVLLGSFLSFKMVEKKEMFPGLPFPVLFGLLASFIALVCLGF